MSREASNLAPFLAVVFDMDGVIFDTETLYFEAGQILFRRRGLEFTVEHAQRIMGVPGVQAMEILLQAAPLACGAAELYEESQEIFHDLLDRRLSMMPGAIELMERLERHGLPRALATSTERRTTDRMLGQFDLHRRFTFTLTRDDVEKGKPDPEIYLSACEKFGVQPDRVLVLEDSLNGMTAAKRAGCVCVAIPHELSLALDFSAADLVAKHLLDPRLLAFAGISRDH